MFAAFFAHPLARNRDFRLLFSAQVISLVGSGVTTVGLALFAHQLVGGDSAATVIGIALMLRILAFLLFAQFAGVLADRVNRKHLLIAADLLRFALLALFPLIDRVWQVYAMIFLINAATAFFTPTFDATMPQVAGRAHYVQALSLSRVAVDLEAMAAPLLAGLLFAWLGLAWLFWFDAASYLLSAALVLASHLRPVAKVSPVPSPARSLAAFVRELGAGARVLLREAALRRALILSFVEATAGAAAIVATVVYVRDVLHLGESAFVFAMAAAGVGSTVAALLLGRATGRYESGAATVTQLHGLRHRWTERALIVGGCVLGAALLPGILQPPLWLFAALWLLNGAGQALIAIPSATLLAEHTTEANRGRATAAYFALTHAFWLVTYPAMGVGASQLGVPLSFTVAGALCLLLTLAVWWTRTPVQAHSHDGARDARA